MQDGAYLDETEKEMVHLLKTFYGISREDETDRCQDNWLADHLFATTV